MEALLEKLIADVKSLHKDVRKIRQSIDDPTGEKAKARSQNNGFRKPLNVSDELKAFLSLGPEDKISRADVTRRLNEYVTAKGLKNGQHIAMDDSLRSLLTPPEDVQITFLNIQKYINRHYIKEEPAPKAEKVAEAPVEKKKPTLKKAAAK
jgi:upstream activation factor subunit UAF30